MAVNVCIVGATGAVGLEFLRVLEQREFPVGKLRLFASSKSVGKRLAYRGTEIAVEALAPGCFRGSRIGLFSPGSAVSKEWAPVAAREDCLVVDNSSAFRGDPEVPLVVPEVNAHAIARNKGIIANPNCSTIQMVVALKPLHDVAKVRRVVVTTFQSVSGAGSRAIEELREESAAVLEGRAYQRKMFPHPIAFDAIPQIPQKDAFTSNLYTSEEMKMVHETRKILEDEGILICPTCVRVPVFRCHSESVLAEMERKLTADQAKTLLARAPGIVLVDDPSKQAYPLAVDAAGKDAVYVGRVREDLSSVNGIAFWCVSDNLRKGAALNAVQIAETALGLPAGPEVR
ncbi:MAG: aspartate-semialdehyde dehydrogenase [Planctomycetota bacterium]